MWTIALYGTNEIIKPATDSTLELTLIDATTNPMTDARWLKIPVIAINPHWEAYGDIETGNGGIAIHPRAQVRTFAIQTGSFVFPDDMATVEAIATMLNKRRVFLYKGDYPETATWELHADGKALCIAATIETEDDHEHGCKDITIAGRAFRVRR